MDNETREMTDDEALATILFDSDEPALGSEVVVARIDPEAIVHPELWAAIERCMKRHGIPIEFEGENEGQHDG